jgi:hypothetical protein
LFLDLVERVKRRGDAVDSDDMASAWKRRVGNLASRVAAKHAWLAKIRA